MSNGISMYALAMNLAAVAVYLAASGYLVALLRQRQALQGPWVQALAFCAVAFHWYGLYPLLFAEAGVNFSFFATASLIFAAINSLLLLSGLKKPVHTLYLLLMPLSALSIVALIAFHEPAHFTPLASGVAVHVVLSLLAYSLLTIATAQALVLAFQTHQLKNHHTAGAVRILPPLQTMEGLLFDMLWLGFALLSASLISGLTFVEDLLAQHLAHKTVFSILAWFIYAALLAGRHFLGWRGHLAIRFTLGGFAALMLAYFGSKFVLELVLGVA
ncbi:cytochrome c biogenesis protein CcsA [Simiduia sp. 21SJ11W-1]|uniref:cytochrome C assembly family protein n=1 Tax=Simiduia sp. 21SJ11W-1 TaxID=2909669 RepID=UPI0020A0142C|nr:cytochrome c biogenesis protein CcsA [Simiduia sp. 21SJ11W-1]UTA46315.1 cytochrome c biogenesis protein CcsA [Simiduia sp. 21SJ11W-1]